MNRFSRHPTRQPAWALLALGWLLLMGQPAHAGPWEARTAQGLTVTMSQNPFRHRDAFIIERRYPDKTLDAGFGREGSVFFSLGPDNETPGALRVDVAGRIWVAGSSSSSAELTQAVVLRFQPNGAPDASWADAGRSATAPAGRKARAQDLVPLADGGAWVAGQVQNAQGLEQAGWWRLRPDGRVDPGFGLGGLWVDDTPGATEVVDLAVAPDGSAAVALRRGGGTSAQLEAWVVPANATAPQRVLTAADDAAPQLQFAGGRWGLRGAAAGVPALPPAATEAGAPVAAASPVGTAASAARPPTRMAPAAAAVSGPEAAGGSPSASWVVWLLAVGAALLIGALALRRRR